MSLDSEYIREEGAARKVDIVMFGHTHKPYFEQKDGITVLNPGSLAYPRQEGRIGYKESGENGFGYDPIFYLPEYGCTTAQLSPEQKNEVSHRGKALCAIKRKLKGKIGDDLL